MAAAPAIPSIEDLLANIPGLRKGGAGSAAPSAATAAAEKDEAPAGKRPRKGKGGDAPAPAAAAPALPPVHSLNVPDVTATLDCPAACVGSVIGKGGYTIKSIQAMSGASVQVAKEAAGSSARTVTISGAPACVAAAQAMVAQAIAQAQQPRGGSRPGAPSAAAGPRVELRLPCPADRIGWVIGAAGATVKALRVLTGAQLDMLEEVTETGGRRGVIVLSGTAEAVDEAKTAVGGLIGAAHAAASKAYAAQLTEAAEARRKWDEEQARAQQAPPAAAEGAAAEGEAQPDASAQAAAAAAAAAAEWKEMTAKHPDGTTLRYWRHAATGMCRW